MRRGGANLVTNIVTILLPPGQYISNHLLFQYVKKNSSWHGNRTIIVMRKGKGIEEVNTHKEGVAMVNYKDVLWLVVMFYGFFALLFFL